MLTVDHGVLPFIGQNKAIDWIPGMSLANKIFIKYHKLIVVDTEQNQS